MPWKDGYIELDKGYGLSKNRFSVSICCTIYFCSMSPEIDGISKYESSLYESMGQSLFICACQKCEVS
jgi:hypothetical protein